MKELVADEWSIFNLKHEFAAILPGGTKREGVLKGYSDLKCILGNPEASEKAAEIIVEALRSK